MIIKLLTFVTACLCTSIVTADRMHVVWNEVPGDTSLQRRDAELLLDYDHLDWTNLSNGELLWYGAQSNVGIIAADVTPMGWVDEMTQEFAVELDSLHGEIIGAWSVWEAMSQAGPPNSTFHLMHEMDAMGVWTSGLELRDLSGDVLLAEPIDVYTVTFTPAIPEPSAIFLVGLAALLCLAIGMPR